MEIDYLSNTRRSLLRSARRLRSHNKVMAWRSGGTYVIAPSEGCGLKHASGRPGHDDAKVVSIYEYLLSSPQISVKAGVRLPRYTNKNVSWESQDNLESSKLLYESTHHLSVRDPYSCYIRLDISRLLCPGFLGCFHLLFSFVHSSRSPGFFCFVYIPFLPPSSLFTLI